MRRSILVSTLLLAGCATAPRQQTPRTPVVAPPARESSRLIGLTAPELVGRFGNPALQVREGSSLKLQFRAHGCVLDAYLYPSGNGLPMRVTHVDTRSRFGVDIDQATCILAVQNPS